jgi:ATP-dependent RNA helicase RhlE
VDALQATEVERFLSEMGMRVGIIHGDKTQQQREGALEDFKRGKCNIIYSKTFNNRGDPKQ